VQASVVIDASQSFIKQSMRLTLLWLLMPERARGTQNDQPVATLLLPAIAHPTARTVAAEITLAQLSSRSAPANHPALLADALASIDAQSENHFELIVVDGNSTDSTARIARAWRGVRYDLQPDSGLTNARNLAIAQARGELIAFLDHDDLWAREKLAVQSARLLACPQLGYTTSLLKEVIDVSPTEASVWSKKAYGMPVIGSTPSTLTVHRHAAESVQASMPPLDCGLWIADYGLRIGDLQEVPSV
jgi:hypothetical protein